MIKKYLVKLSPTDQPVGVMHFMEQARLKVGGNKSATFTIEHVFKELCGEVAKNAFHIGNGKIVFIHDAKSVDDLQILVLQGIEKLASEGWYVYTTSNLGRVMR